MQCIRAPGLAQIPALISDMHAMLTSCCLYSNAPASHLRHCLQRYLRDWNGLSSQAAPSLANLLTHRSTFLQSVVLHARASKGLHTLLITSLCGLKM